MASSVRKQRHAMAENAEIGCHSAWWFEVSIRTPAFDNSFHFLWILSSSPRLFETSLVVLFYPLLLLNIQLITTFQCATLNCTVVCRLSANVFSVDLTLHSYKISDNVSFVVPSCKVK